MAAGGFSERLAILITADGASAISEFKKVGDSADKDLAKAEDRAARMSAGFTKAGVGMMATSAVMIAGLYNAGQSAAALEQAVGGTEAVFKDASGAIDEFAKASADSAGLSEEQARTLTTRLGGALKGLGFETKAAADQAVNLTKIGADLAATYGGTTAEAVDALGSAFRGEFDPAERFNLFLKQSTVDAKAVAMGLAESTANVDANARAQATLALIVEQSADAQGQFAREAGSTSGQLAIAQANIENAKAELGAGFTPVMSKAADVAGGLASGFGSLNDMTNGLAASFTGFAAAGLGVAGAISFVIGKAAAVKTSFVDARSAIASWSTTKQAIVGVGSAIGMVAGAALTYKGVMDQIIESARELGKMSTESGMTKFAEEGTARLDAHIAAIDEGIASLQRSADEVGALEVWNFKNRAGFDAAREELERSKQDLEAYRDEVQRVMDTQGIGREAAIAWVDGVDKAGDAATEADGRTAALNSTMEESTKAYDDATKMLKEFVAEQWGLTNANAAAEAAIDDTLATIAEHGFSLNLDTEAGRANIDMLQEMQLKALEAGRAEAEKTQSVEAGMAASQAYAQRLRDEITARYGNTAAVQAYIAQLGLTPEQVSTAFQTAGLDEAIAKSKEFQRLWGQDIAASIAGVGMTIAAKFGGARADGGPVNAGRSYIVGERGPELFTPGASGTITPNHAMPAAGGTQTIVLQIDGREIARAVVDQVRAA